MEERELPVKRVLDNPTARLAPERAQCFASAVGFALAVAMLLVLWGCEPSMTVSGAVRDRRSSTSAGSLSAETPETTPAPAPASIPATPAPTPASPSPSPTPASPSPSPTPSARASFDPARALVDIRALEKIGVRNGGSRNELRAASYLAGRLRSMGYSVTIEKVPLPHGRTSRNVLARRIGYSRRTLVLGAHMDSKKPSPGANDNGSGCAAILEIARSVAGREPTATIQFVFFGCEEMVDSNPNHHHYGSRFRVASLTAAQRASTAGMISVDMIGVGHKLVSRNMRRGPQGLSRLLVRRAAARGLAMSYLKDPSAAGWSDHEPFERAGIPVSWVEWRDDPNYHTVRDTSGRVKPALLRKIGQLLLDFVLEADDATLAGLRR